MLGVGIAPITSCPHCSILINGTCEICEDGDPHPSCHQCVNGRHVVPWYQSGLFLSALVYVSAGITTAILVHKFVKK